MRLILVLLGLSPIFSGSHGGNYKISDGALERRFTAAAAVIRRVAAHGEPEAYLPTAVAAGRASSTETMVPSSTSAGHVPNHLRHSIRFAAKADEVFMMLVGLDGAPPRSRRYPCGC